MNVIMTHVSGHEETFTGVHTLHRGKRFITLIGTKNGTRFVHTFSVHLYNIIADAHRPN